MADRQTADRYAADPGTPLVQIRNVSKTFPGQRALDGVSFDLFAGEVHALLGHNGSGKSTLIKVLAGFHEPDPGATVLVRGKRLPFGAPGESAAAGLRFVHQDLGLIDDLTVLENVALSAGYSSTRTQTISWSQQRRRTRALLAQLDADIDVDAQLATLPAIDKSVVAIARALDGIDNSGGLLVLDEPTAALPPDEVDRLFVIVRRLRDSGVSTLYVTHRMDEVFLLTDRLTVLRDGRHQITGPAAEFDTDRLVGLILGDTASTGTPSPGAPPTDAPSRPGSAAADSGEVLLDVTGLRSPLLRDVDLRVHAGEIIGVAGVMGSGREDIGPALVGAVDATAEGYVTAQGTTDTINPRRTRALGVVLVPGSRGTGSLIEEFTITENLTFPVLDRYRRVGVLDKRTERGIVERWIDRFDVRPRRPGAALRELSGGNKQKVLVAKWLNTDPRVLILDAPTAGVDVGASAAIHAFIREVAAAGMGCIVASSDVADLTAVCSRVLVLRHGTVAAVLEHGEVTEENILRAMAAGDASPPDTFELTSGTPHG